MFIWAILLAYLDLDKPVVTRGKKVDEIDKRQGDLHLSFNISLSFNVPQSPGSGDPVSDLESEVGVAYYSELESEPDMNVNKGIGPDWFWLEN